MTFSVSQQASSIWQAGSAPVAVVMISLNEAHHLESVLENLRGWAQEVFLVDSYSSDQTVDIALKYGVHVVQRRFRGFGDQWNFAMEHLPIRAPWTMKLDPDERLTDELKSSLETLVRQEHLNGMTLTRKLWFMGRRLPVEQPLLRVWRTGQCRFSNVLVNEYPSVPGQLYHASGVLEHHDSPDLDHWVSKQNAYTTSEAISTYRNHALAEEPRLLGTNVQRRMWLKKHFRKIPGRFVLMFWAHYLFLGAWRAGRVGWIWSRLRTEVYRIWEYKLFEIQLTGRIPLKRPDHAAQPDNRVRQYEN